MQKLEAKSATFAFFRPSLFGRKKLDKGIRRRRKKVVVGKKTGYIRRKKKDFVSDEGGDGR